MAARAGPRGPARPRHAALLPRAVRRGAGARGDGEHRAARRARPRAGDPGVLHRPARPAGPADRGLLTEFWGDGIGAVIDADPQAADIVPALAPAEADTVLVKWRYSAFQRSTFAEQLAALGRDQLLITGVYAHIGLQATAVEAFMRDVQPFLVADAVADFSRERHDQACAYVAQRCGAVTTTADALAALSAPVPAGAAR